MSDNEIEARDCMLGRVSSIVIDETRQLTRCVSVSSIAKRSLIPGLVVLGARDVSSRACASCKMQVVTSCGWSVGTTKEATSAMRLGPQGGSSQQGHGVDCPIRHLARDRGSSYWQLRGVKKRARACLVAVS